MTQDTQLDTLPPGPAGMPKGRFVFALFLAALALLAAVAAGGGAYYLWRLQSSEAAAMQLLQRELGQLQSQARDRDAAQARDLATLRAQQKTQQEALELLTARQDDTHTRSSREWTLSEAEYLLQIANQRLQLDRDVASAIAAMAAANERLRDLADPALLAVRRQLAIELSALRSVPLLDREGLVLELISYAQRVDQLPLANAPPPAGTIGSTAAPAPTVASDWRTALDAAWQALQRLVIIRRDNQPIQPMLAPEQEYFLRQNLRLQLESARVALLRDEAESFKASLQSSADWLRQYFDTKDQAVTSAIEALDGMAQQNIRPPLPSINESLRLLRLQLAPERIMEGAAPTVPLSGLSHRLASRSLCEGRRLS